MTTSTTIRKLLRGAGAAAFWLAAWYLAARALGRPLLLPGPAEVASRFAALAVTGHFWRTAGATLLRVAAGFAAGTLAGALLAVLCRASGVVSALFSPVVRAVRAAPVASFIILLVVWFRRDSVPVIISALMALPVVWENTLAGIASADPALLEMARSFHISRAKTALRVVLPSALPSFLAGCRTALGLAWKSGVTAEVIASPALAVGRELNNGRVYLETADVFVWTAVVILLSVALEKGMFLLLGKAGKRYGG